MADPLEVLRQPAWPLDPDPAFARSLRARLERALAPPEGSTMPSTSTSTAPALDVPVGVVPYLAVTDPQAALDWYADALGATEVGDRYELPDGSIGHAEMRVHGATFYLSGGYPEGGVAPPVEGVPVSTSLVLTVLDVDEATDRAVAAGARLERAPGDHEYGRISVVHDPYGHRWMLEAPVSAPTGEGEVARPGDLAYAALWTPDVERAEVFYAAVLGWEVAPGSIAQGRQVTSTTLSTGLWGGQAEHTLFCCWQVDDVDDALRRVREAGGTAGEPRDEPYGLIADCVDPQGLAFAVIAPHPGAEPAPRTPLNGSRQGDLSYLTMEVADEQASLAFYGAALGWRLGDDGEPDVHPMLGISSGHDRPRAVPCWKVDDVAAAVERVRAAGGSAEEPARRPYGMLAACTDDQGAGFYVSEA